MTMAKKQKRIKWGLPSVQQYLLQAYSPVVLAADRQGIRGKKDRNGSRYRWAEAVQNVYHADELQSRVS